MVLTLVEHDDGDVDDVSLEALTFARKLSDQRSEPLEAVLFGPDAVDTEAELDMYGVEKAYAVENDDLTDYAPLAWAKSVSEVIYASDSSTALAAGTDRGGEIFAHLASVTDLPLATNVIAVESGEEYGLTRQRWGGSLHEHSRLEAETKLLTTIPHELPAEPIDGPGDVSIETVSPALDESDFVVQRDRYEDADTEGVPLDQAPVVVGGGRGVDGPDGFDKLEELADHTDGAVGSSRAAVNEGWRPHDDQIGQTGNKIAPELYIPCGISGAVQHWVGCKGSENVLAINTDPEAAIVQKADYAVIADLHETVPRINELLREK